MGRYVRSSILPVFLVTFLMFGVPASAQRTGLSHEEARALDHQNPVWESIRAHLPDPGVATAAQLESAADVLRARRFLEDALDYYNYALRRGGEEAHLLNKMGVTQLELRNVAQARAYFQRVVKVQKKNPEGWNNLGAIEYLTGRYGNAISNYKRAIKLDKTSSTYHSNLGTAYFDKKDFENARKEYDIALKLDPEMLNHHGTVGVTTRMLSPEDHARFSFELARLYAQRGDEQMMLRYLTKASEAGFDVLREMGSDSVFSNYRKDPRVLLLVQNAKELRNRGTSLAQGAEPPPPLPPAEKQ
ncbi:tetratricopeptide repeat protein [Edaphobacter aggregans]|uniref:tetratricopeptide repeat protein n=1 Tax=Edaphobacter aggregans TaxID=570835 RepID=UPI0005570237|nr:tetratricopeptide repeat protein [Edaphobacter aggregans]